jgi:hypothetical protein
MYQRDRLTLTGVDLPFWARTLLCDIKGDLALAQGAPKTIP